MHRFLRNLITDWRKLKLPFADENIIIAVSGGADSVSLALALHQLFQLKKLKNKFVVAHFNHELRGTESAADEIFVKELAHRFQFDFISGKPLKPLTQEKGNLEQLARNSRYEFLAETSRTHGARIVLTGHTLNDQAETFLFNLLRGSGIEGLSAMKPRRILQTEEAELSKPKNQIELVRPFLTWAKREDTVAFCLENGTIFREDSMNTDRKFVRVRIRQELIPLLETFNPKIIERLAKTSELLRLESQSEISSPKKTSELLVLKNLKSMSKAERLKYLRDWLKRLRGDLRSLSAAHFEAIDALIFSRKSGRIVELPNGGRICKKGGKLSFERN